MCTITRENNSINWKNNVFRWRSRWLNGTFKFSIFKFLESPNLRVSKFLNPESSSNSRVSKFPGPLYSRLLNLWIFEYSFEHGLLLSKRASRGSTTNLRDLKNWPPITTSRQQKTAQLFLPSKIPRNNLNYGVTQLFPSLVKRGRESS